MFTGLIEQVGTILAVDSTDTHADLTIGTTLALTIGDSLALNGVCLTVTELGDDAVHVHAMTQTLHLTTIGELQTGSLVNLERALAIGDRLGGHFVSGHVDGIGVVESIVAEDTATFFRIETPLVTQMIAQGSIAIDGISLTITSLDEQGLSFAAIPHTLQATRLHQVRPGDQVNVEVDMLGKFVARHLELRALGN